MSHWEGILPVAKRGESSLAMVDCNLWPAGPSNINLLFYFIMERCSTKPWRTCHLCWRSRAMNWLVEICCNFGSLLAEELSKAGGKIKHSISRELIKGRGQENIGLLKKLSDSIGWNFESRSLRRLFWGLLTLGLTIFDSSTLEQLSSPNTKQLLDVHQ